MNSDLISCKGIIIFKSFLVLLTFLLELSLQAQDIIIPASNNIPTAPNHAAIDSAYNAEIEKLNKALNTRSLGSGVASYSNGKDASKESSTNGTFTYPKGASGSNIIYKGNDLQACINAMVSNPEHNGGTIEFNGWYKFYSGENTNNSDDFGTKYSINGYGKVKLKCMYRNSDWGILNIAKHKTWTDVSHYQNLPHDTVIISNIVIDGGNTWKTSNIDPILGRSIEKASGNGNGYPMIWMSNEKGVLIINDGTIIQNVFVNGGNTGEDNNATKGGAINHRRGKFFMYGGAVLDCSVTCKVSGQPGASGAGIYVRQAEKITVGGSYDAPAAEFYMYGGTIAGCYADAIRDNLGGAAMYIAGKAELMGGVIGMEGRGNKANQGGGFVVVAGADVKLGGTVKVSYNGTDNKETAKGGGVYVCGNNDDNPTTFTMEGGEISNNISYSKGGGLYMKRYSTANIRGGAIYYNTVSNSFDNECGGGIYLEENTTLNLTNEAAVKGNVANYNGGGIYSKASSTVNLFDCTVANNTCGTSYNGAGVYYAGSAIPSNVNLSGSPKVYNNYAGEDNMNNLYMAGSYVNITGNISKSALVNLLNANSALYKVVGKGASGHVLTLDEAYCFAYDDVSYGVQFNDSVKTLRLATPHHVNFDMNDNGSAGCNPPSNRSSVEEYVVTLPSPEKTIYYIDNVKYVFIGWNSDKTASLGSMTYTMGKSDVTLYAIWANPVDGINVYLDGGHTPGSNNVGTISNPSNSFSTARSILLANMSLMGEGAIGRIVIINHPVSLTTDATLELGKNMSVVRYNGEVNGYPAYTGNMFNISDGHEITLRDIIIDGNSGGNKGMTSYGTIFNLATGNNKLNIDDGAVLQNNHNEHVSSVANSGRGGAVYAAAGAIVNLKGGSIKSCKAQSGGAVYTDGATINVESGTIGGYKDSGNAASNFGSAIAALATSHINISGGIISYNYDLFNNLDGTIYSGDNTNTATISGGTISNNTAKYGGGISTVNASFNITGGTISDNIATTIGGGVYVKGGTTYMSGGMISGNNATNGGGVYICTNSNFEMKNNSNKFGQITQNTAKISGGGVYVEKSFEQGSTDTKISVEGSAVILTNKKNSVDNNVYLPDGVAIRYTNTLHGYVGITTQNLPSGDPGIKIGIKDEAATSYTLLPTDAENIYSDNASYDAYLNNGEGGDGFIYLKTVAAPGTLYNVYIDGVNGDDSNNGEYSTPIKTFSKAKSLLRQNDGTIYIINKVRIRQGESWSLENKTNAIVRRYDGSAQGHPNAYTDTMIVIHPTGTLILNDIKIDGGGANATPVISSAPAVMVKSGGNIAMFENSVIRNNCNTAGNGGAILVQPGGSVIMNAESLITGNSALNGGGIYLSSDNDNVASLDMNGTAEISDNKAIAVNTIYGNEVSFTTSAGFPTVSTTAVVIVDTNSVTTGGTVISDGGSPIKAQGVCWSTTENPTTSNDTVPGNLGDNPFTCTITGLAYGETYYVRAYVTTDTVTSYGDQIQFNTNDTYYKRGIDELSMPSVTTNAISDITSTTAQGGGEVTSPSGLPITGRGICWSTSPNPIISDAHTSDGSGTGSFTSNITGLVPHMTYYVRAYATNSSQTGCGGGVFAEKSQVTMNGGIVRNNNAGTSGSGIYLSSNIADRTLNVSGDPVVAENLNDNIFLNNTSSLDVVVIHSEELHQGAYIGVTLAEYPQENMRKLIASSIDYNSGYIPENEAVYYVSDKKNYYTSISDGKIYIGNKAYWKDVVTKAPLDGWRKEEYSETYLEDYTFIYQKIHISTPEALAWIISVVNGINGQAANTLSPSVNGSTYTFQWISLDADIDLSQYLWTPIGTEAHPFDGYFTGNGHIISGLSVYEENMDNVGFIGYAKEHYVISDIGINNSSIIGRNNVGGIVGYTKEPSTDNSYMYGFVFNSYYHGYLRGADYIGGLVGYNNGRVQNCYAVQEIDAPQAMHKGYIAGYNDNDKTSTTSYNTLMTDQFSYCYGLYENGLNAVGGGYAPDRVRTFTSASSDLNDTINIKYELDATHTDNNAAHRLSTALNRYIRAASPKLVHLSMQKVHKWKRMATTEYPVHAVFYGDYWKDVIMTEAQAGIGFQRNDTKKTIHIASAEGLAWLISVVNGYNSQTANDLDGYYIYLDSDIDMSAHEFTPIGNEGTPFNGVLAGDGKKIKGIYICNFDYLTLNYTGLVGYMGTNGVVRNLHLDESCYMLGGSTYLGAIVAYNNGNIYNSCYLGAGSGFHNIGGISAYNKGNIFNCYVKTNVVAHPREIGNYCGGIVGINDAGANINNCYVSININLLDTQYGGMIAGWNKASDGTLAAGNIENVYLQHRDGISKKPCGTDNGTITNAISFSGTNALDENVTVTSTTNILLTALNEYVNENQTGVYSTWRIKKDENEGYPHFNYDAPFVYVVPTEKWEQAVTNDTVVKYDIRFEGGGTNDNPYLISNNNQLAMLMGIINGNVTKYGNDGTASYDEFKDKYYKVTTDLNIAAYEWTSIGNATNKFIGVFDGGNHIIESVYIGADDYDNQGFFGYLENATVKHLGVSSSYIKSIAGRTNVGGITGYNKNSKIYDCYNIGYIHGKYKVGGIAGCNDCGLIYNCYNLGTINGTNYVGGIIGYNMASSTLANSFNRGPISTGVDGANIVYGGGVLGYNVGTMMNVYNAGLVTGSGTAGVLGINTDSGTAEEYYWDNDKTVNGIYSVQGGSASTNSLDFSGDYTAWIFNNSRTAVFSTGSTHDLVKALNEEVKISNQESNTNYKMWRVDASINDGYPTFSDVYNYSSNVLWYVNGTSPNYEVNTPADLAGLADLTNYYNATTNNYLYYDEDGVVRDHGTSSTPPTGFSSVPCYDFAEIESVKQTVILGNDVVYNDGTFAYDGTFTPGSTEVLSAASWNAIGTEDSPFKGIFDGDDKTIQGIFVNSPENNSINGMFGCIDGAEIKDIGIVNSYIGTSGTGSIVGGIIGKVAGSGKLIDSYCTGIINNKGTSGNCYAGGLVGYLDAGGSHVKNCYSWANVYSNTSNSTSYAGGITGYNIGTIDNTYNAGYIYGMAANIGSLVGINDTDGNIKVGNVQNSYYLFNTAVKAIGRCNGTADDTISFTGTGSTCKLAATSAFGYDLLGLSLNSWRMAQSYAYNTWFPSDTYYVFGSASIYWTDIVTSQPEGFKISGMNIDIESEEALAWLISVVNGYNDQPGLDLANVTVTLKNDLYMNDYQWVPIGTATHPFRGTFIGSHYLISNVYCLSPKFDDNRNVGIFGSIDNATLHGILAFECQFSTDLTDEQIGEGKYLCLGTIAAYADGNSIIDECRSKSSIYGRASQTLVSGIVGYLDGTSKVYCSSTSSISAGYTQGSIAAIAGVGTEIKNCYARCQPFDLYSTLIPDTIYYAGGIVGKNYGTVENCYYMQTASPDFSVAGHTKTGFIAGKNNGTINYCYANRKYFGIIDLPNINTNNGNSAGCGYFYGINDIDVPQEVTDRQIVILDDVNNAGDNYVTSGETRLNDALNNWVKANNNSTIGYSTWVNASRYINYDYPVFRYKNYNTVTSVDEGLTLFYIPKLYTALERYNNYPDGGYITVINNADITAQKIGNDENVHVYILEDVSVLHNSALTSGVDIRIDNSSISSKDFTRDYHLVCSPFNNLQIAITNRENNPGFGNEPNPSPEVGAHSIIPYRDNTSESLKKWDMYSFYEPQYHWINFKRGSNNHWHEDSPHDRIIYENEISMIQGKGYMVSLQDEFLLTGEGLLNNGDIKIPVTCQGKYCKGYNLIGNPYQSYLDFDAFVNGNKGIWSNISEGNYPSYYSYDADNNGWIAYAYKGTATTASQYIHMHQGFFIIADNETNALFTNDMRTNKTDSQTHFRGEEENNNEEEKILYPFISVKMSDADNNTETVVAELGRPDEGGAARLTKVRDAKGSIFLKKNDLNYWILFYGTVDNIPLWFEAKEDGTYTLEFNTGNGTFSYLHLIDNITGEDVDLLLNNKYTFTGRKSDYKARFRLVFSYVGLEENATTQNGDDFAYFDNGQLYVNGEGTLQVIDIHGRILYQTKVTSESGHVSLPSLPASVYILRLVGEEVKVQKVVVK